MMCIILLMLYTIILYNNLTENAFFLILVIVEGKLQVEIKKEKKIKFLS